MLLPALCPSHRGTPSPPPPMPSPQLRPRALPSPPTSPRIFSLDADSDPEPPSSCAPHGPSDIWPDGDPFGLKTRRLSRTYNSATSRAPNPSKLRRVASMHRDHIARSRSPPPLRSASPPPPVPPLPEYLKENAPPARLRSQTPRYGFGVVDRRG